MRRETTLTIYSDGSLYRFPLNRLVDYLSDIWDCSKEEIERHIDGGYSVRLNELALPFERGEIVSSSLGYPMSLIGNTLIYRQNWDVVSSNSKRIDYNKSVIVFLR